MTRAVILMLTLLPGIALAQQAGVPATPPMQQVALPGASLPGIAKPKPPAAPGEVSRDAPVNGVLILYGNQRCPTDTDGNEIVVCRRRSASEQYRVPKDLRELKVTPQNESWAAKVVAERDPSVGVNAVGTCSVVGPGGQSGCFQQQAKVARGEKKEQQAEDRNIP